MEWNALAQRSLAGSAPSPDEALAFLRSPDDDLLAVLHAAFLVRSHYHGRPVPIQVLRNAKSGLYSEDSAFCRQSILWVKEPPR